MRETYSLVKDFYITPGIYKLSITWEPHNSNLVNDFRIVRVNSQVEFSHLRFFLEQKSNLRKFKITDISEAKYINEYDISL